MGEEHEAYCFKCRAKVIMTEHEHITLKNGKPAVRGVCPNCGTKEFRIGNG